MQLVLYIRRNLLFMYMFNSSLEAYLNMKMVLECRNFPVESMRNLISIKHEQIMSLTLPSGSKVLIMDMFFETLMMILYSGLFYWKVPPSLPSLAQAKAFTDQGTEFLSDFQDFLNKWLIENRTTSQDHPESDGMVERILKTVKKALCKYGLQIGHVSDWDLQLPWLDKVYRFSKQASLASFSPYKLIFGREIELPTSIRSKISGVLKFVWIPLCSKSKWSKDNSISSKCKSSNHNNSSKWGHLKWRHS